MSRGNFSRKLILSITNDRQFFSFLPPLQLYEALNVSEHQIRKERDLHERLEVLNTKLGPLEQVRRTFDRKFNFLPEKREQRQIELGCAANGTKHFTSNYESIYFCSRKTQFSVAYDI